MKDSNNTYQFLHNTLIALPPIAYPVLKHSPVSFHSFTIPQPFLSDSEIAIHARMAG